MRHYPIPRAELKLQVIKLGKEGMQVARIVEVTDVPDRTVRRWLQEYGLYRPVPSPRRKHLNELRERIRQVD